MSAAQALYIWVINIYRTSLSGFKSWLCYLLVVWLVKFLFLPQFLHWKNGDDSSVNVTVRINELNYIKRREQGLILHILLIQFKRSKELYQHKSVWTSFSGKSVQKGSLKPVRVRLSGNAYLFCAEALAVWITVVIRYLGLTWRRNSTYKANEKIGSGALFYWLPTWERFTKS